MSSKLCLYDKPIYDSKHCLERFRLRVGQEPTQCEQQAVAVQWAQL